MLPLSAEQLKQTIRVAIGPAPVCHGLYMYCSYPKLLSRPSRSKYLLLLGRQEAVELSPRSCHAPTNLRVESSVGDCPPQRYILLSSHRLAFVASCTFPITLRVPSKITHSDTTRYLPPLVLLLLRLGHPPSCSSTIQTNSILLKRKTSNFLLESPKWGLVRIQYVWLWNPWRPL